MEPNRFQAAAKVANGTILPTNVKPSEDLLGLLRSFISLVPEIYQEGEDFSPLLIPRVRSVISDTLWVCYCEKSAAQYNEPQKASLQGCIAV